MKRLPFAVRPFNSAKHPHLKFVVRAKIGGKWRKNFFKTEAEAKTFAHLRNTELLQYGTESTAVPTWLRMMAQRCQERLAPFRKSIEDATNHYLEWIDQRARSCSIPKLFAEVHATKEAAGLATAYCRDFLHTGEKLAAMFPDKFVSDLTTTDIDQFLSQLAAEKNYSALTRNGHRRIIRTALEYAMIHGYCARNVAHASVRAKVIANPVGILRPGEMARFLANAAPEILPALAIGAFAGLRTAEIKVLDWSQVDLREGFIEVTAKNAKSSKRRLVKILPNLQAWLKPFAKDKGLVLDACEHVFFAGRSNAAELAGVAEFPKNALRHSYASYHLAHFKDAAALALEMGHSTTDLIFEHYRQVVRQNAAAEYWSIAPFSSEETARVHAFTAEAWPWCCRVETVADGSGINGEWYRARYSPTIGANYVVKRFARESAAHQYAAETNARLLAKALRLDEVSNVIEFSAEQSSDSGDSALALSR